MDVPRPSCIPELDDNQLRTIVEVMYLIGLANGVFEDREKEHFRRTLEMLSDGCADETVLDDAVRAVVAMTGALGLDGYIIELSKRLATSRLRELALILASNVAGLGGEVHRSEELLLNQITIRFALATRADNEDRDTFAAPLTN